MGRIGKLFLFTVFFLGVILLWLRRFGAHLEQKAVAPDRSTVAEVRLNTIAAATDASVVSVRLYPSILHFGDTVFEAATYGGRVRITWQDRSHLLIHVLRPKQLAIYFQRQRWRGVTITYEDE